MPEHPGSPLATQDDDDEGAVWKWKRRSYNILSNFWFELSAFFVVVVRACVRSCERACVVLCCGVLQGVEWELDRGLVGWFDMW